MIEPHTTRTYDEAFARARSERAAAFRALLGLDTPRTAPAGKGRGLGWGLFARFA